MPLPHVYPPFLTLFGSGLDQGALNTQLPFSKVHLLSASLSHGQLDHQQESLGQHLSPVIAKLNSAEPSGKDSFSRTGG